MQVDLLIFITNQIDCIPPILSKFMDEGISGATVVECEGMVRTLYASNVEPPPIIGSLRKFLNPDHEKGKMLFAALQDDKMILAKDIIHKIAGSLNVPNSGVMFTIPIISAEGVGRESERKMWDRKRS